MAFQDSITYKKLHKYYGDNICNILEPWNMSVETDTIKSTDTLPRLFHPNTGGYTTMLNRTGSLNQPAQYILNSTSAEDKNGGNGVSHVRIVGLDEAGTYREEIVALNGNSGAVTTTYYYSSLISAEVHKLSKGEIDPAGTTSNFGPAGDINIITSGAFHGTIYAGEATAKLGYYFVPSTQYYI